MELNEVLKTPKLKILSKILEKNSIDIDDELLFESPLDPIHKNLNLKIFDSNKKMLPTSRKQILDGFYNWFEQMGYEKNQIKNMTMIGSNTGYQYTTTSDVDVNIITSLSDDELDKIYKLLPNGNLIKGTQNPINYYLAQDMSNVEKADAAYDLLKNEWYKKPDIEKVKIPYYYVLQIARFFMDGIELQISQYNRDKYELEMYKNELEDEDLEIEKDDIKEMIARKETEIIADLDSLEVVLQLAKSFRQEAFEPDYEPRFLINITSKSPNFSINNIVYKILDRFKYIDRLHEIHKIREKYKEE